MLLLEHRPPSLSTGARHTSFAEATLRFAEGQPTVNLNINATQKGSLPHAASRDLLQKISHLPITLQHSTTEAMHSESRPAESWRRLETDMG